MNAPRRTLGDDMPALGMIIDSSRCINCKACLVSCKVANTVPEGQWRNWIKSDPGDADAANASPASRPAHYQPGGCMQCANAPCLAACPTGATYRNMADGVILVDKGLCIGCGNCIPACPYSARFRHGVENVVDKCDFCAARRKKGLQPACVDTCITRARTFGPLNIAVDNAAKRLKKEGAPPLEKLVDIEPLSLRTAPRLHYVNHSVPDNWPTQPAVPLPMRLMTGLPGKALFGLSGLSFLGVLGMWLIQFRERRLEKPDKRETAENCKKGVGHDPILILRHSLSDRVMHWGNALLWLLLLLTGIALADHPQLAILGQTYPAVVRKMVGGGANLLNLHIATGAVWVVSFIVYGIVNAKGAGFFLRAIFTPQKGDLIWLMRKGAYMILGRNISRRFGVSPELPPQGYYNAGQRVLAVAIVLGCMMIAASGIFMALSRFISEAHYPFLVPGMVGWALLAHHISVWLIVSGLFVHIYMAAISAGERPALFSMFSGTVPADYARHHHPLWDTKSADMSDPTG